jgi:MFS family permease
MDSIGAFLGPLVALGVLAVSGQRYDAVFVSSFCVALFGVFLLLMFVQDRRGEAAAVAVPISLAKDLLQKRGVRRLVVVAAILGLTTVGDGFVYLLLQRRETLSIGWFPVLAVGTSLAYLVLATPLGVVADRLGRLPVVLAGYAALVVVYLALLGPVGGPVLVVAVLALYGFFYAATDGVLMALAAPHLPEQSRTTGLALIQTGQAVALLGSSIAFGFAWQAWGTAAACLLAAGATVAAIGATAVVLK